MTEVRYWVYTTTEHMETLDQIRLALAAGRPLVVLQKYPTRAGQTRRPLAQPANTDGNRFIDSAESEVSRISVATCGGVVRSRKRTVTGVDMGVI